MVVLVEGLRLVVYGINDDEPAAADFRCGDGFAKCVEEQLLAISLTPQRPVDGQAGNQVSGYAGIAAGYEQRYTAFNTSRSP